MTLRNRRIAASHQKPKYWSLGNNEAQYKHTYIRVYMLYASCNMQEAPFKEVFIPTINFICTKKKVANSILLSAENCFCKRLFLGGKETQKVSPLFSFYSLPFSLKNRLNNKFKTPQIFRSKKGRESMCKSTTFLSLNGKKTLTLYAYIKVYTRRRRVYKANDGQVCGAAELTAFFRVPFFCCKQRGDSGEAKARKRRRFFKPNARACEISASDTIFLEKKICF